MNRLTMRNSDGTVSQPTSTTVEAVFYRLAEYEDTGLSPEDIRDMSENAETSLLTWFESRYGFPVGELMGFCEAKQQGRLVVLPCKVGDTVYVLPLGLGLEGDFITEAEVIGCSHKDALFQVKYKSGQLDRYTWSCVGKTVFLSREEAEAALKAKEV